MRKYDGKCLMKPSKKSVKAVLGTIGTTIKQHLHAGAGDLLVQLNPILRGWANSPRHTSSKETCAKVDHEVYQKRWGWAKRRHPTKSSGWIKKKSFGASTTRSWEYGGTRTRPNGDQQKLRLTRAQETPITRHTHIQNRANPSDPEWEPSFEDRVRLQMQDDLKGRRKLLDLWRAQGGSGPMCRQPITTESGWNIHHLPWRVKGGKDERANLILLHPNCHRHVHSRGRTVTKPRPVKGASREA
jgi:RNA-directed DNA polymerase